MDKAMLYGLTYPKMITSENTTTIRGKVEIFFISKIASIHSGIEDNPSVLEVGKNLETFFDTEEITKRFYEDFRSNHLDFQKYITGISREDHKKWYSSVVLNRLMFIWFLQKKGFLDGDYEYLKSKLKNYSNKSYYQDFLKLLFFQGFARRPEERTREAKKALGDIKYLNGGLFLPHSIEEEYQHIDIKNRAFEKTFELFSEYNWCLQDHKGKDNEVSSDVLGYIFEKYINEIQQKSFGAYYTKDQITEYLSKNTIHSHILEKANKEGYSFKEIDELLSKLDINLCKTLLTNEESILNTLTVLDPAVGSGAFLVSAMKVLLDIYSPIVEKIKMFQKDNRDLCRWYRGFQDQYKSDLYGIKKSIILNNLYGVDIMKEATETCKLRLFLSLVSSALNVDEMEPLPNIDFNIMYGNSLIGFLKHQTKQTSLFGESYEDIKKAYNNSVKEYKKEGFFTFKELKQLKKEIFDFLKKNASKMNQALANECNNKHLKFKALNTDRKIQGENSVSKENIKKLDPFHWNFAFNQIMDRGGFDIIITNPPWEKVEIEDKEFFSQHKLSIDKKKTPKKEMDKIKKKLLKNKKIKDSYIEELSLELFQRNYFSIFYQYQKGEIIKNGKIINALGRMDTYRLFAERCFDILNKEGFLGMVLPSGLCKDDGSIGLRKHIFDKTYLKSIIDFQNQMENGKGRIFEEVHPSFKFILLSLKKDKPQDEFSYLAHQRDLDVLDKIPEKSFKQSIKSIKEISPRDCAILEFQNPMDISIFKKAQKFPMMEESTPDLWNVHFYQDFNKTSDSNLFRSTKNKSTICLPLYEGKAIYQYEFNYDLSKIEKCISLRKEKVQGGGHCFKHKCYKDYRLVIRTIARNTDERSLIAAVIPKNNFIVNSLHGVSIDSNDRSQNHQYMLLLQSFLNSFVVDFFIRKTVSANINKKYIIPLRIPRLKKTHPCFKDLVKKSAMLTCIGENGEFDELAKEIGIRCGGVKNTEHRWKIQGDIDAIVASIYGLSFEEFEYILSTFTTGRNQERLNALKKYALEAFKNPPKYLKKAS